MKQHVQNGASKQLLLLLVVAVLLVSLVGTWLVLQNSFDGQTAVGSTSGVVSFSKSPVQPVTVAKPVQTATVSFVKQG